MIFELEGDNVKSFANAIRFLLPINREIVFLCIGSIKCKGDSIAPRIGTVLRELNVYNIYGDTINPVHASNLEVTIEEIKREYDNPFIIAIDASIGRYAPIGSIGIHEGGLRAGAGCGRNLPCIGDLSIKPVIANNVENLLIHSRDAYYNYLVGKFVQYISEGIRLAMQLKSTSFEMELDIISS